MMSINKESQNIEWKQTWQDESLKSICGFANAQGGQIYIGIDDSGQVVGLSNAEKLMENLPNKIRNRLGLVPQINLLKKKGKNYIEIIIEASTVPISLSGSYYYRLGSTTQELKDHALTDFLLNKTGMTWDRAIENKATLDDIDKSTIDLFKKTAAKTERLPDLKNLSMKEILKKLRLLTRDGLTRAALILFGKDPGEFYPNLFVKIGRFGNSDVDLRFQETCEGNLIQILRDVIEQLERKFLIKPIRFEGIQRIEELEYPIIALREMILNALVHRNYLGSMTQLKIYDGRVSLWNAGKLPEELTVDQLYKPHESIPRNPLIAEICYKLGYIESWGLGVEKIIDACKKAQLPTPKITERSDGVLIELFKNSDMILRQHQPLYNLYTSPTLGNQLGNRLGNALGNQLGNSPTLGNHKEAILNEIEANPRITVEQLAKKLQISTTAIEKNTKQLKEAGFIKRIGTTRGYWEIVISKLGNSNRLGNRLGNALGNQLGNSPTLGNHKEAILNEIKANPRITVEQLAKKLQLSTTAIDNNTKQLKEAGFIKRIGTTRGYWEIQNKANKQ